MHRTIRKLREYSEWNLKQRSCRIAQELFLCNSIDKPDDHHRGATLSKLIQKVAVIQFWPAVNKWVNEVVAKLVHVGICTPSQLLHSISTNQLNSRVRTADRLGFHDITIRGFRLQLYEWIDRGSPTDNPIIPEACAAPEEVPPPLSPSEICTSKDEIVNKFSYKKS